MKDWRIFRTQFFVALVCICAISGTLYGMSSLIHWIHRDNTYNTATVAHAQNQLISALITGNPDPALNANENHFVSVVRRDAIDSRPYNNLPTVTNLPFTSRTYIFGTTSNNPNPQDPNSYKTTGNLSKEFKTELASAANGTLRYHAVPNVGPRYWVLPVWVYLAWFELATLLAYLFGLTDTASETLLGLKINFAELSDSKWDRIFISLLIPEIAVWSWIKRGWVEVNFKMDARRLMKDLSDPSIPLNEELKQAMAILKRVSKHAGSSLPEAQQTMEFITKTVDSLKYAKTHAEENAARMELLEEMEKVVPLAKAAHEFHSELHKNMNEHATIKLSQIKSSMAALEAGAPAGEDS